MEPSHRDVRSRQVTRRLKINRIPRRDTAVYGVNTAGSRVQPYTGWSAVRACVRLDTENRFDTDNNGTETD
jgi:hypothetical protein